MRKSFFFPVMRLRSLNLRENWNVNADANS